MSRQITAKDIATLPQPGLNVAESFSFSPDDKFITYLRSPNDTLVRQLYTYNYTQNSEAIYVQPPDNRTGETEDNLSQEEKLRRERQRQLITGITRYSWAKKGYLMLIPIGSDLYIKDESQQLKLLIKCESNDKPILDPRLSRDGKTLAYVQDSELYVIATDGKTKAKQLTTDARYADKTNGLAEFIAQEEMDRFEGFWWSNDSKYIAYTQVDETNVPVYRIAHQGSDDPLQDEEHHYPFAGKSNVNVRLAVVEVETGFIKWINLSQITKNDEYYIARVKFFHDNTLAIQIENRLQTNLKLLRYDIMKNELKILLEENSDVWINLHNLFYPLENNQFIWASEQSGFMHLELRDYDGKLIRQLTSGDWVVFRLIDVDETNELIYFLANRESPLYVHLYSVSYQSSSTQITRHTEENGCHTVSCIDHKYERCIDTWNSLEQHPVVRIINLKTNNIEYEFKHLQQNQQQQIQKYQFIKPELFTIQNRHDDTLYCALYRPVQQQQPLPTIVSVYGGPHAQRVINSWALTVDMRAQLLVQQGYVVIRIDNRGSANRGLKFESAIKHDLGNKEVEDQVDGINYLIQQGICDKKRVGIFGWSYGGYMALCALVRANDTFKLGIAGAPVTHWDGYDTHYTERYMGLPAVNVVGYKESSVMHHIQNLNGHLMIIHGLIDENVHFRHTARLINALIKANKSYELLSFPDERHMPRKMEDRLYMETRIIEFIKKYL